MPSPNREDGSPCSTDYECASRTCGYGPLGGKVCGIDNNAGGGKATKTYAGRKYVVRTGKRGGRYILVKGKKIYL